VYVEIPDGIFGIVHWWLSCESMVGVARVCSSPATSAVEDDNNAAAAHEDYALAFGKLANLKDCVNKIPTTTFLLCRRYTSALSFRCKISHSLLRVPWRPRAIPAHPCGKCSSLLSRHPPQHFWYTGCTRGRWKRGGGKTCVVTLFDVTPVSRWCPVSYNGPLCSQSVSQTVTYGI
jgi:hypothetical protein